MPLAQIVGVVTAVPSAVENEETWRKQWGDSLVDSTIKTTGIRSVHLVAEGVYVSDLFVQAGQRLLSSLNLDPSEIGGIVVTTQTPDYRLPAVSCLLQSRLGLPNGTFCVDINYGCSGFVYGLEQARMLLNDDRCKHVLVFAGDVISKVLDREDHTVRMVFGDAGAAALVSSCPERFTSRKALVGLSRAQIGTDGSEYAKLVCAIPGFREAERFPHLSMDGLGVMTFALTRVPPLVRQLESDRNEEGSDPVNFFFFHQANQFIVRSLAKKLKLTDEQAPVQVREYGNTGPASIPLAICLERREKELGMAALVGFGVGLSWAGITCDLGGLVLTEVIEVE